MPLLTLESVCLAYGHVALLDHVDLALDAGDKVALIGRNGTGKSSLLRIIAGAAAADDGAVWRKPGLRLAHVPQEPQFAAGHTVFEAAAEGLGEVQRLLGEYERVAHELEARHDEPLIARLEELGQQLESGDGWRVKSRVEMVLSPWRARAVASLESGESTRATISATARSRSGLRREASKRSTPSFLIVPRTAATWPWGRLRSIVKASSGATRVSPRSTRRSPSMVASGRCERLARVRFFTRPPSR
jgi:energy-coupling factor transporter ATP-binding protein EcfA2